MDLRGGDRLPIYAGTFFPPLRQHGMPDRLPRAGLRSEEAGELIDRRPQDLSLQEMYEVAQAENARPHDCKTARCLWP